jgi:hypothetical protein
MNANGERRFNRAGRLDVGSASEWCPALPKDAQVKPAARPKDAQVKPADDDARGLALQTAAMNPAVADRTAAIMTRAPCAANGVDDPETGEPDSAIQARRATNRNRERVGRPGLNP